VTTSAFGTRVLVYDRDAYERLLASPASLEGWFNPTLSYGEVSFASPQTAVLARRDV